MIDFDLIKGRLERFSKKSLTNECLRMLLEMQTDKKKNHAFWNLLVLLKWIMIYSKESFLLQKAERSDIVDTLILIEKFESDQKVIDFKKGIARGFRIIAYQQFWAQDQISGYTFDNQLVLYMNISGGFDINQEFVDKTGLSFVDFFNMSYILYAYLILDKVNESHVYTGILEADYFMIVEKYFGKDLIEKFLDLLTLKESDLSSIQKMKNEAYQLYEPSFWSLKPLLNFEGALRIPHRSVFEESIRHFIYDYMKRNSSKFTEEFGSRVEKYIELGLKELNIDYLTETELKKKHQLTMVADFLIEGDILVESKAIELHPRSGILRNNEILFNEFEDSIIKSYKQMLLTATAVDKTKGWLGLVVTYKDTYCGFGADAWDEFLRNPITKFVNENHLDLSVLPPERICFIKLEDWDMIVQNVIDGKGSIREIVEKAIGQNNKTDLGEKILFFEQALRKYFPIKHLNASYLVDARKFISVP